MTDYKLVPVEPTAEMVEAAKDAYMPFGDMELAIRMAVLAAPAVQGEPVAWNDLPVAQDGFVLMPRDLTNEMVRAFCMATVHRWDDVPEDQKIEVAEKLQHAFDAVIAAAPQLAEQQPAPDVDALVEALSIARDYVFSSLEEKKLALAGYPKMWRCEQDDLAMIDAALAAHRKGGRP